MSIRNIQGICNRIKFASADSQALNLGKELKVAIEAVKLLPSSSGSIKEKMTEILLLKDALGNAVSWDSLRQTALKISQLCEESSVADMDVDRDASSDMSGPAVSARPRAPTRKAWLEKLSDPEVDFDSFSSLLQNKHAKSLKKQEIFELLIGLGQIGEFKKMRLLFNRLPALLKLNNDILGEILEWLSAAKKTDEDFNESVEFFKEIVALPQFSMDSWTQDNYDQVVFNLIELRNNDSLTVFAASMISVPQPPDFVVKLSGAIEFAALTKKCIDMTRSLLRLPPETRRFSSAKNLTQCISFALEKEALDVFAGLIKSERFQEIPDRDKRRILRKSFHKDISFTQELHKIPLLYPIMTRSLIVDLLSIAISQNNLGKVEFLTTNYKESIDGPAIDEASGGGGLPEAIRDHFISFFSRKRSLEREDNPEGRKVRRIR